MTLERAVAVRALVAVPVPVPLGGPAVGVMLGVVVPLAAAVAVPLAVPVAPRGTSDGVAVAVEKGEGELDALPPSTPLLALAVNAAVARGVPEMGPLALAVAAATLADTLSVETAPAAPPGDMVPPAEKVKEAEAVKGLLGVAEAVEGMEPVASTPGLPVPAPRAKVGVMRPLALATRGVGVRVDSSAEGVGGEVGVGAALVGLEVGEGRRVAAALSVTAAVGLRELVVEEVGRPTLAVAAAEALGRREPVAASVHAALTEAAAVMLVLAVAALLAVAAAD